MIQQPKIIVKGGEPQPKEVGVDLIGSDPYSGIVTSKRAIKYGFYDDAVISDVRVFNDGIPKAFKYDADDVIILEVPTT